MEVCMSLDSLTRSQLRLKLFKGIKNVQELRENIMSGQLKCCFIKPHLILDPLQVIVAANKAVATDNIKTKSVYTEILFNLSISKNITESLKRFGVEDSDNEALVVVIRRNGEDDSVYNVFNEISGDTVEISKLGEFSDISIIKKHYKISDAEAKESDLLGSVISRIATKDVM